MSICTLSTRATFRAYISISLALLICSCSRRANLGGEPPGFFFSAPQVIELCIAISRGNEKELDRLVAKGVDVNTIGKDRVTPLFWALGNKRKNSFRKLLEHGANPNICLARNRGASVMSLVCGMKDSRYLDLALKHGGDVNVSNSLSETPIFDLIRDLNFERIKFLVSVGADLNHQDISGRTPMMAAASLNQYDMAHYFLEHGADPTLKSKLSDDTLRSFMRSSYKLMTREGKQFEWLLKFADLLRKKGVDVKFE